MSADVAWTDDGIFRAAYLHTIFDEPEREEIRRAGVALAKQAITGDAAGRPGDSDVPIQLKAAAEDLRMVARHLQELSRRRREESVTETDWIPPLCERADTWAGEVSDLAHEISCRVDEAQPASESDEAPSLRRLLKGLRTVSTELGKLQLPDPEGLLAKAAEEEAAALAVLESAIREAQP